MIVADEDVDRLQPDPAPEMSAFIWFVDITDESHPVPVMSRSRGCTKAGRSV
jgi:hypothetical protein